MTGSPPSVSDEDLHAFIDGEKEPEARDAIFRFLAASPADAARIDSWRRQNETLQAAFARVAAEPPPASVLLAPPEKQSRFSCRLLSKPAGFGASGKAAANAPADARRGLKLAALLLLAFAGGIITTIGAALLADRLAPPDVSPAPSNHTPAPAESDAIFVGRTVAALQSFAPAAVAPTTSHPAAAKPNRIAVGQGPTALILPTLAGAGLRLSGVRIAPSEFDRMFCFFYARPPDAGLALCVEKIEDDAASGFHQIGRFPASAIDWRQVGARYALAGPLPDAELRALAEQARDEIEAFGALK